MVKTPSLLFGSPGNLGAAERGLRAQGAPCGLGHHPVVRLLGQGVELLERRLQRLGLDEEKASRR